MKEQKTKKRFCLALDLIDDPDLIKSYIDHHQAVPEAVIQSIQDAGILVMDIFITGNRLFMIMEVQEDFSFDKKTKSDADNESVQDWEKLMDKFQQRLPWAKPGEKWVVMEEIFSLEKPMEKKWDT